MDTSRKKVEWPSCLLSGVCVVIGLVHFSHSAWKADWVLVGLVVLCFLPWMGSVFESIGGEKLGAKYRPLQGQTVRAATPSSLTITIPTPPVRYSPEPGRSVTAPSTPPIRSQTSAPSAAGTVEFANDELSQTAPASLNFDSLTFEERTVLATLWKYQKRSFPNSSNQMWTFVVSPLAQRDYMIYARGFAGLIKLGLAEVAANSGHATLSLKGLDFCERNDAWVSSLRPTFDDFVPPGP